MKPPPGILDDLEEQGRSGAERVPASLAGETLARRTLRCGRDNWRRVANERSSERIADLIRGLILYRRASGHLSGGSTSPVIVLYDVLVGRRPSLEPELTKWIVEHSDNPWEPFGTLEGERRPTSYSEYVEGCNALARFTSKNIAAEEKRQEEARKRRVIREREESTQRLANAVRRGDLLAVQALLAKGADVRRALPEGESLVTLAESNGRASVAEFLRSLGIT